jgi:hypothetical protein
MTASEEQSLEEEYENQESWHVDDKSWCFLPVMSRLFAVVSPTPMLTIGFICRLFVGLTSECTFIILDKSRPDTDGTGTHGGGAFHYRQASLFFF